MNATDTAAIATMLQGLDADTFHIFRSGTMNNGRALRDSDGNLRSYTDAEQDMVRLVRLEQVRRYGR